MIPTGEYGSLDQSFDLNDDRSKRLENFAISPNLARSLMKTQSSLRVNEKNRVWSVSTIILSFMTALVFALIICDKKSGKNQLEATFEQEFLFSNEPRQSLMTNKMSLVSFLPNDDRLDGNYEEDMKDAWKSLTLSQLRGVTQISCSDSVSWGRSA
jgi:hypothetical protein